MSAASRRLCRRSFLTGALGVLAAACTPAADSASSALVQPRTGQPLTVALPNSDLAVGQNRFVLALLDAENNPIPNAPNTLRFYLIRGSTAELKGETNARYYRIGPGDRGIYVARTEFGAAGNWGVEVLARLPNGQEQTSRVAFVVAEKSKTPALGSRPPASRQPIVPQKPLEKLCTARPPDPLHDLTVADALAAGKPALIMLGSPGFCSSATCGPNLEHILAARQQLGDRLSWIHIEIYQDAQPPNLAPVVSEWNLPSEPWIFLINAQGQIVEKFEGGVAPEELNPALERLLAA
ncbi:MAG: hypothetical protein KatS3mg061_0134 [Dehalococcoidia bacterium]|nr:MAG: hypothetical protein KatS3mg061_0134 [Dehalococcoidia bacterium]